MDDSLLDAQLRKQAAAHGLRGFQPFLEDDETEECAEKALREESAELQSFAGLRESTISFALPSPSTTFVCPIVEKFESPEELLEATDPEELKSQLATLGLKCGGTPANRAARLFKLKGLQDLDSVDKNLFAKRKASDTPADGTTSKGKLPQKGPLLPHQSRKPGQKRLPRRF
mmetsp:Transcript_30195/g.65963  ORF Transcript_30195/g.65963 Transcript_30195/m.65963 type:complete len:173 (+) Transcript_30195:1-519(+)